VSKRLFDSVVSFISRFFANVLGDERSPFDLSPAIDQLPNSQFFEFARVLAALRHKVVDERHHEAADDGACERRDEICNGR
jgi:hypothetical protein